jgi:DNA (cytosine-5)-methyltransferase 1
MKKFTFIDLFAGIGGLRIPFEKDGQCVFTSEINPSSRQVYANYFKEKVDSIGGDINLFTDPVPSNFPRHDLLLAGFPCQPFSHAGLRQGFDDIRGTLFFSIAAIAKARKPKILLLENVKGLINHDNGYTFARIVETLESIGYVVHSAVLNARDFGLAQNRNRVYIVAIKKTVSGASKYQFPKPTHDRNKLRVSDFLDKRVPKEFTISDRLWVGHQQRKARNQARGTGFGFQAFESSSSYVATISARYYKDGSEALIRQKGRNPRKLTPNEIRRLQGFPEGYPIHKSKVEAYKHLGNAVPVAVVAAIAKSLEPYLIQR